MLYLFIDSVTKKFAGKFVLTVSNASGSDSAKAEVKVLDRPAAPEGLQATVEGTTCSLLWKKSKDDGGAPIEHYQVSSTSLPNVRLLGAFDKHYT